MHSPTSRQFHILLPFVVFTLPPSGSMLHTSSACARTCRCHSITSARAISCVVDGLLLLQTLRTAWVQCWRRGRAWRGTIKRLHACACACSWFNAGPLGFAQFFRAKIVIVLLVRFVSSFFAPPGTPSLPPKVWRLLCSTWLPCTSPPRFPR